jgi:hypothetical protein
MRGESKKVMQTAGEYISEKFTSHLLSAVGGSLLFPIRTESQELSNRCTRNNRSRLELPHFSHYAGPHAIGNEVIEARFKRVRWKMNETLNIHFVI